MKKVEAVIRVTRRMSEEGRREERKDTRGNGKMRREGENEAGGREGGRGVEWIPLQ